MVEYGTYDMAVVFANRVSAAADRSHHVLTASFKLLFTTLASEVRSLPIQTSSPFTTPSQESEVYQKERVG